MTEQELDKWMRDKVWGSKNTGSDFKEVTISAPELFELGDDKYCLVFGKAIIGPKVFVSIGLGSEEDYYHILKELCSTQSAIN